MNPKTLQCLMSYKNLIEMYLTKKIDIKGLTQRYDKLFFNQKHIDKNIFSLLEKIFEAIDACEPNEKIRSKQSDYISETTLREELKVYLKELKDIVKKNK